MIDQFSAVADLQTRWHTLKDVDRAYALRRIIQSGVSGRTLASALNCSESLIRHLLLALQAGAEDLELARRGSISTNELVRRGRANRARCDARQRQSEEQRRAIAAGAACRQILNWLAEDDIRRGNAAGIVQEARTKMMLAERTSGLPGDKVPAGMTQAEIISRCRPEVRQEELDVSFHARWLALWAFYAMPDYGVRWTALDQALSRVSSRYWIREL